MPSIRSLVKVAGVIGLVGSSSVLLSNYYMQKKICSTPVFKEVVTTTLNNPHITKILGEPITMKKIDIYNKEAYNTDGTYTWMTIPLKGTKGKGDLRFWVLSDDDIDIPLSEKIVRIELSVNHMPGKKLVIKNKMKKSNES
ncbi:uncharacterized protein [Prorops nasuta]|uniref:uncharacterized protein n=1 Tax=Prorops nasuta TaxID=863751 RepID=UPI0034CFD0CA